MANENVILSNILDEMRQLRQATENSAPDPTPDPTPDIPPSRAREEARERAKKLRDAVKEGFGIAFKKTGLNKLASFAKTGGKGILFGSALVAFFAVVNSPLFDKFVDFLRDKIIPGIGSLIEWMDKHGINIKNAIGLIFAGLANVGSLIANVVGFFEDPEWDKFTKILDENLGTLAVVIGLLAPKLLLGGLLASVKLLGGAFALLGTRLGNVNVPTPPTGPTPTLAAQNTARSSNLTNSQMARMGVMRNAGGALVESGVRPGSVRSNFISAADMNTRLDQAGVRRFQHAAAPAGIARQFPRLAKILKVAPWLMTAASVVQLYSLLGSDATKEQKVKGAAKIFGGLGGGLLGAKVGGLLGTLGGPIGILGGGIVGGIGGYFAGEHIAELLAKYALGENITMDDVFPGTLQDIGNLLMDKGSGLAKAIAAGDTETAKARVEQATQNLKVMPTTEGGDFQGKDAIAGDKGRLVFGDLSYNARAAIQDQVSRKLKDKAALFRGEEGAQRKILMEQRLIQKALTSIAEQLALNAQTVLVGTTPVGTSQGKGAVVVPMGSINSQNETLKFYGGP